jgi:vancomycin resistance protein VanJ
MSPSVSEQPDAPRRERAADEVDRPRRHGRLLVAGAVTLAVLLAGHRLVPQTLGAGGLLESLLPWLGLAVPVLALAALLRRAWGAGLALMLPAVAWSALFGPALLANHSGEGGGGRDLRVVTHNLRASNPDPRGSVAELLRARPDLLALQEVNPAGRPALAAVLDPVLRYHVLHGRSGLWSRYPIRESSLLSLGPGKWGVLRAVVAAPGGPLAVWVAHPARLRLGVAQPRDTELERLAGAVAADPVRSLLLVGDLNTASTDRALGPVARRLRSAQADAGSGLGFTWPAPLPVLRIDHVFYRGLDAVDARVLGRTGSDHRPVLADLRMTTAPP